MFLFCLFWGFPSHSRIFHSNGDVTITSEELQPSKFNLVRVFCVPHLLRHGTFIWSSPSTLEQKHPAESLAAELLIPIERLKVSICRDQGSNPDLPHVRRTFYQLTHWKTLCSSFWQVIHMHIILYKCQIGHKRWFHNVFELQKSLINMSPIWTFLFLSI